MLRIKYIFQENGSLNEKKWKYSKDMRQRKTYFWYSRKWFYVILNIISDHRMFPLYTTLFQEHLFSDGKKRDKVELKRLIFGIQCGEISCWTFILPILLLRSDTSYYRELITRGEILSWLKTELGTLAIPIRQKFKLH